MALLRQASARCSYWTGFSVRLDQNSHAATFSAVFVGESLDGPLGVRGMRSITDCNGTTTDNRNNDMFGAFGADLDQFETLFRP